MIGNGSCQHSANLESTMYLCDEWQGKYLIDVKWFVERYSEYEIEEVKKINNLMTQISVNMQDIPEILDSIVWQEIMSKAKKVLYKMRSGT